MKLPENFSFSQYNLQDYVDCKFRFLVKHVRRLEWPAIESEPLMLQEARMELGHQFHRLVQQYFAGVDPVILSASIQTQELSDWWDAFLSLNLNNQQGEKSAEKLLSIPLNGHRLLAKFDFLYQLSPQAYIIYDWKTSVHQTPMQQLQKRLQTRVYPYVLWHSLIKGSMASITSPEVEMVYWFPSFPTTPQRMEYSQTKFEEDQDYLTRLTTEILTMQEEAFVRTTDLKRCSNCRYRSLCDRGISAGTLEPGADEDMQELEFNLDFDSI